MKIKNIQILNANEALGGLADEPLKGKFKFKVFKIKAELEKRLEVVLQALDGVEGEDERHEILMEEQEVSIDKLTTDELENIDLSIKQMAMLKPIIAFEDEKENE